MLGTVAGCWTVGAGGGRTGVAGMPRWVVGPALTLILALAWLVVSVPAESGAATGTLSDAESVSASKSGHHACALGRYGQVACWGENLEGQIGTGAKNASQQTPAMVSRLFDAVAVTTGGKHTCAIRENGRAACWGKGYSGQLGDGSAQSSTVPTPVTGIADLTGIAAGDSHTCAVRGNGKVFCWGDNAEGQLGIGNTSDRHRPTLVSGLSGIGWISAGGDTTCAVAKTGEAWCWGDNPWGNLGGGDPGPGSSQTPVTVSGVSGFASVDVGGASHTCGAQSTGQALCWGRDNLGQLGRGAGTEDGDPHPSPVAVSGLSDAASIAAGGGHSCAVRAGGQAVCWGQNDHGQLGRGTADNKPNPFPADVSGLADAHTISAGTDFTCTVRGTDREVYCWGSDESGQLGNNAAGDQYQPVPVDVEPGWEPFARPTLMVDRTGPGTGEVTSEPAGIDCGTGCRADFDPDSVVTLTAEATPGSVFTGWGGACAGTGTCRVKMERGRVVTASFSLRDVARPSLTVFRTGDGEGTVVSSPAGIDCGTDCEATFTKDSRVTLVANPEPGSVFTGWNGACTGLRECVVKMSKTRSVWASFSDDDPDRPALVVLTSGDGTGLVSSSPAGIECRGGGAICQARFDAGAEVVLTAANDPGTVFSGWGGACSGTGECRVTMDRAHSVWAFFDAWDPDGPAPVDRPPLRVFRTGTGSGQVVSNPAGIDCGNDCVARFSQDAVVTLTASAAAGSVFTGWNGACTGTGSCRVTMDQAKTVTADFAAYDPANPPLTVFRAGNGEGTVSSIPGGISCGRDCQVTFAAGTVVTLTPSPAPGSVFTGWSGACSGTGACSVRMDRARSVWASFSQYDPARPPLVVFREGDGQGTVTSNPAGINCTDSGAICQAEFDRDTTVTLTATPRAGSTFAGWAGDCAGTGKTCRVTMDRVRAVRADFDPGKPVPPVPPNDGSVVFDPATGRLVFRLKCTRNFRPRCLKMVAQAVTRRGKRAKRMSNRVTVRNRRAGKWKFATLRVKPRFRKKVARMGRVKRKTLLVRIKVKSKVRKVKRVRRNGKVVKVKRMARKTRTVHHRYRVLVR